MMWLYRFLAIFLFFIYMTSLCSLQVNFFWEII